MSGLIRIRNRALAKWRRFVERPTPAALARAQVRLADSARERGDWPTTVFHYAAALSHTPTDASMLVQHAHALKEVGRIFEAEGAYRAAISARPQMLEIYLHLADLLRLNGRPDQAVEVFVQALKQDPDFTPARDALVRMGERKLLPTGTYGRAASMRTGESLALAMSGLSRSLALWSESAGYPGGDYDAWRRTGWAPPPVDQQKNDPVIIIIDARAGNAEALATTARSIQDQHASFWTAFVMAPKELADHAVSGRVQSDPRFRFIGVATDDLSICLASNPGAGTAWVASGTVLDPHWLSWTRFAMERTRADAVYSDHDHFTTDWRTGQRRSAAVLQGLPCLDDLASNPSPPIAVLIGPSLRDDLKALAAARTSHAVLIQNLLLGAFRGSSIVHVPHVLASAPMPDSPASPGQYQLSDANVSLASAAPADRQRTIAVIIPTRDYPDLLTRFVSTLRQHAARPERVRILIMDNRSQDPATTLALTALRATGVEVLNADEPFNWARINNLGAAGRAEDILIFANNDMEMLTPEWDDIVENLLEDETRGIVGARLLYPDETVQHAGVAMGVNEGRPFHEGLGSSASDGGPLDRWKRRRSAAAVTGAFLATRRELFEKVGGFDEELPIAYSDLDFCFRARSEGRRVVFDPSITLIHHESKTRGLNDSESKIAWDNHELSHFYARWGDWIFFDPSINPQWICERTWMFDGFRSASLTLTLEWIDLAGRGNPWRIDKSFNPPETR